MFREPRDQQPTPREGSPAAPPPSAWGLRSWWKSWRHDEFRRSNNRRMTPQDVTGWAVGALLLGSVLLLKVWHEEHLPALAGACTPAVALMAALSRLAARRPQLYAAHRESFVSLGALAISLATHALLTHGGTNHFAMQPGSPLAMLLAFIADHYASWTCLVVLVGRLDSCAAALLLPTLALLPLLALRGGPCAKVLGAPGGADTLDQLHYWLAALHTVPLGPVAHLMPAVFRWEGDGAAHQQCRALDRWYTAAVGVAMPLALLRRWDAEARRSRAAARRRRPGATEGAAAAQDGGAPQRVQQEQRQEQQQEQRQRNDSAAEGDLARWTEGPGNKGSEADVSLLQAVFLSSSTLWVFMTALHAW